MLYAAWVEAGLLTEADVLNLRKLDSDLEGHPTPVRVVFTYAFAVISSTLEYVKRLVLLANCLLLLTDLTTHFLMLPAHLIQYECVGEYMAKIQ